QGTAIEDALQLAIVALEPRESADRFIILLSDGENFEGEPMLAAEKAAEQGIVIHALGYGEPLGAPIPVVDESSNETTFKIDETGELVLSRLNEEILEEIANATGGLYQHATTGIVEVHNIIERINEAEATTLGNRIETRSVERLGLFIALAFITLTFEILLPETNRRQS
ncbi:MAG: hypothetical protein CUN54_09530, partial [Phototrophicales bacterium]